MEWEWMETARRKYERDVSGWGWRVLAKLSWALAASPLAWGALQRSCGYSRRIAQVACGRGLNVKVVWGTVRSKSDSETPGWGWKVNVCSNPTKKTNSSILARLSPIQFLLPAEESSGFT